MGPLAGLDGGKSHPTGIRSRDPQARSQSLYRLSYPATYTVTNIYIYYITSNPNLIHVCALIKNSYKVIPTNTLTLFIYLFTSNNPSAFHIYFIDVQ